MPGKMSGKQPKFKTGERVICIKDYDYPGDTYDDEPIKQGDVLFVEYPFTLCCMGVKFKDRQGHYADEFFESHPENATCQKKQNDESLPPVEAIDKNQAIKAMNRLTKELTMSMGDDGFVHFSVIRKSIIKMVDLMGIREDFLNAENR